MIEYLFKTDFRINGKQKKILVANIQKYCDKKNYKNFNLEQKYLKIAQIFFLIIGIENENEHFNEDEEFINMIEFYLNAFSEGNEYIF